MNAIGHLPGLMEAEVARRLEHAPYEVRAGVLSWLFERLPAWPLPRRSKEDA